MVYSLRPAIVNRKLLVGLCVIFLGIVLSVYLVHKERKQASVSDALRGGMAAFDRKDWSSATYHFKRYLARVPDDVTVLEKFARAHMAVRPFTSENIKNAINAWRALVRLKPDDAEPCYQLFVLYNSIREYREIGYIAQKRLLVRPRDTKAALWLAKAFLAQRKKDQARDILVSLVQDLERTTSKHPEYGEACILLSSLAFSTHSAQPYAYSKEWLDRALRYDSNNVLSLLNRARFYRACRDSNPGQAKAFLSLSLADLNRIGLLKPEDPGIRLMVCAEWIKLGEFGRAAAELDFLKTVDDRTVLKYFTDLNDWLSVRFIWETEVLLQARSVEKGRALADSLLMTMHSQPHRAMVLPSALRLYLAGGSVVPARRCLDEYLTLIRSLGLTSESQEKIILLQALVASAEKNWSRVIDLLEPLAERKSSLPQFRALLKEAYARTNQARKVAEILKAVP
jgi:tetratricopeptide (TPR) repeat protein